MNEELKKQYIREFNVNFHLFIGGTKESALDDLKFLDKWAKKWTKKHKCSDFLTKCKNNSFILLSFCNTTEPREFAFMVRGIIKKMGSGTLDITSEEELVSLVQSLFPTFNPNEKVKQDMLIEHMVQSAHFN